MARVRLGNLGGLAVKTFNTDAECSSGYSSLRDGTLIFIIGESDVGYGKIYQKVGSNLVLLSKRAVTNTSSDSGTWLLGADENIAKITEVKLDNIVNQCQGFTYNSDKNQFILACVNSDNTKQVLYVLDGNTFSVLSKKTYSDKDRLGHCNTLCYFNRKVYVTNGVVNPNKITVLSDALEIESQITVTEKVHNLAYDTSSRQFISILPGNDNTSRVINYYDESFHLQKTKTVNVVSNNNDTNGALSVNGNIIIGINGSLLEFNNSYNSKSIGINKDIELEDFVYKDSKVYMTSNYRGRVILYCSSKDTTYYLNINSDISDGMVLDNNIPLYGKDTNGTIWSLIKLSKGNGVEAGHKDKPLALSASRVTWWDGSTSRSLLSTKDFDEGSKVLYRKSEIDDNFITKEDLEQILNKLKSINGES